MTHPILSRIPFLGKFVDERFLEHRRRSTSVAGLTGAGVALVLYEYRLIFQHRYSWDLLAVLVAMVMVKMSMMIWYRFND